MELVFKTKNPKQIEAAEAWIDPSIEEILYGGAKGGAKSYTGASLIFGAAHTYPETQWFIARKELIDLKKFTIPTIHEVHQHWGLDIQKYLKYDGQLNVFTLPNKSKVFLIACADMPSDPLFERFGSMQMTGGWIEEAGEIAEAAKANLRLSIGRWKNDVYKLVGKLFITANPKKGWMKREFVDPYNEGTLMPHLKYIQAFATDNPYLPQDYIKKLREERDPVRRQRLYEGSWDYDENQDALVSYDALTDAFSNTITKDGERYMVVDVARLGKDATTFTFWDGLEQYRVEKYHRQTTDKTVQQVKDFAAQEKIPYSHIIIDEDGVGGGVVDALFGVKGFTANSVPIPTLTQIKERASKVDHYLVPKTTFANLKAQCGWKLAELINTHEIAFKVPEYREELIEDLTSILRNNAVDSEAAKRLRPKDEVKQELGRSPDLGDTCIMRAYFELVKESTGDQDVVIGRVIEAQAAKFSRTINKRSMNSTQ